MKIVILAVLVAGFVVVPTVEARYFGPLQPELDYSITVSNEINAGRCTATAILVTNSGTMGVDYVLIYPDVVTENHAIPTDVIRLIILIDADGVHACTALVSQADINVGQIQVQSEGRLVFDVISSVPQPRPALPTPVLPPGIFQ